MPTDPQRVQPGSFLVQLGPVRWLNAAVLKNIALAFLVPATNPDRPEAIWTQ
jgi:hypothetical protein